jgi:agmatine/peptidylarginine deiminase
MFRKIIIKSTPLHEGIRMVQINVNKNKFFKRPVSTLLMSVMLSTTLVSCQDKANDINPYDESGDTIEPQEAASFAQPAPQVSERLLPPCPASTGPLRMIAEWEPMQGALIRYPLGIPINLVAKMAEKDVVYVIVDASQQASAATAFRKSGVNMTNVRYIPASSNSYWVRDYAAWWTVSADKEGGSTIRAVDPIYYSSRPNDDRMPEVMARHLKLPCTVPVNLAIQGGNIMSDGATTGVSTSKVYEQNPEVDSATIKNMAKNLLGLDPYHIVDDTTGTYIKHIDTWAKFISPTKLIIRRVPESDPQYAATEAAAAYFSKALASDFSPYTIFRVDTPHNEPYTNHLILNRRVFVPVFKSEQDDPAVAAALNQIREAYGPEYEVHGILPGPQNWLSTDSLHCRVNAIPDFNHITY